MAQNNNNDSKDDVPVAGGNTEGDNGNIKDDPNTGTVPGTLTHISVRNNDVLWRYSKAIVY